MNIETATHSITAKILSWWKTRKELHGQMDELLSLGDTEIAEIAADCGISRDQLIKVVQAGPHAADEMVELMRALNIDPDAVQSGETHLFHDMQLTCTECRTKEECRRHLNDGTVADTYNRYCANSAILNELRAEPEMMKSA
jgi:hypothetical protein